MQQSLKRAIIILIATICAKFNYAQSNQSLELIQITSASGQQPITPVNAPLPQMLPASPEPSAFVKASVGNANMATGAVSASIPLYTIKIRDFSFPLSISYSTQGLKADEPSSRVGQGWVLNTTGVITRSVKGKPDEFAQRLPVPATFVTDSDPLYYYCTDGSSSTVGGDTQPDEFQFNVNGYSGKFVLDANNVARSTSTTNVKIAVEIFVTPGSTSGYIGLINLTTPDGVKYQFGSNYEKTTDLSIAQFTSYKLVTKTAFFLDNITLPTGESVTFNYSPIATSSSVGFTQTLQISNYAGGANCEDCTTRNSYTTNEDRVSYATRYLTGITSSTGLTVNLEYSLRPDLSHDNRLTSLEVVGLKKYGFEYSDVAGSSAKIMGRFFLTKLKDINLDIVKNPNLSYDHVFAYEQLASVPLPITYSQDYLGYYNNSGLSYFVPPYLNSNNTIDFSFRNPNASAASIGTLKSIQYPTGGKEEFIYEGNTTSVSIKRNTMTTYDLQGLGGGSAGSSYQIVYTNNSITVPRNQTVTLNAYTADAILDDGFTADPTHVSAIIKLYEGATLIASRSVLGYTPTSTTVNLLVGHTYKMELTVKSYTEIGYFSMTYDASDHDIYDISNVAIPGLRIKQIKLTDPISLSTSSKYFTYATLADLNVSTGATIGAVNYLTSPLVTTYCAYGMDQTDCRLKIYSSSSTNQISNYASNGSPVYYNTVIESDDPSFIHGGTENNFYANDMGGNQQTMIGQGDIPYLPMGQYPTLSGVLYKTRVFDNNKNIISEETNNYETMIYSNNVVPSFYIRKRFEPWQSRADRMTAFDVIQTNYHNYWNRLKSKINKVYSNGTTQTQQTDYSYGTTDNILPAAILNTDSKQQQIKTEYKYATDPPPASPDALYSSAGYNVMKLKNIITPVVEENTYRNGVLLQKKRTMYRDWFNDNKIVMPEFVQLKQSPTDNIHNELAFIKYDNVGNALQVQKVLDVPEVYLWDNLHSVPICEAKNANFDQVASGSFENDAQYGNWQLSSGSINAAGAFTGLKGFSGSLTKAVSVAGVYTVCLWANNTTPTVNGAGGTLVKNATRGSQTWNLYKWTLTNPSTVTVTGTNIDDVRLYPKDALLTSYTYIPFVGVSSITDPNGNVQFYEYDPSGRLVIIRDKDYNVLKKICYSYISVQEGCDVFTYKSALKSGTFTRNNCTSGTGSTVTYTVPLGAYSSIISQADADLQALNDVNANGQNYANLNGACETPVTISVYNGVGASNFSAVYTNVATGLSTTFALSPLTSKQLLGPINAGTYNLTISKPGNTANYYFAVCSSALITGTSATFNNIIISPTKCNFIQFDSL